MIDDDKPDLDDLALEHFGVKGMKWGVRKREELAGPGGSTKKDKAKAGAKAAVKIAKYNPSKAAVAKLEKHYPNSRVTKGAAATVKVANYNATKAAANKLTEKYQAKATPKDQAGAKKWMAVDAKQPRKKVTLKQGQANLAANVRKAQDKLEEPGGPAKGKKKGLSRNQKVGLAAGGLGIAFVGLMAFGTYRNLNIQKAAAKAAMEAAVKAQSMTPDWIKQHLSGKAVSLSQFTNRMAYSAQHAWGFFGEGQQLQRWSYERPDLTIPAGNVFHRISSSKEDGFRGNTYASADEEDFGRYAVAFGRGLIQTPGNGPGAKLHKITFSSKEEIKVPSLPNLLDAWKTVLDKDPAYKGIGDSAVLAKYQAHLGLKWDTPEAVSLFAELKRRGYSAIYDDHDGGVVSENPLILFDTSLFGPKKSEKLSDSDIQGFEDKLVDILHPKGPGLGTDLIKPANFVPDPRDPGLKGLSPEQAVAAGQQQINKVLDDMFKNAFA